MNKYTLTFAKNLKRIRKEKGLSQQKLANLLGMERSSISLYENGKRDPNFTFLIQIATALDVDINELVCFSSLQSFSDSLTEYENNLKAIKSLKKEIKQNLNDLNIEQLNAVNLIVKSFTNNNEQ